MRCILKSQSNKLNAISFEINLKQIMFDIFINNILSIY